MPCLDMKDGRVVKEIHFAATVENRKKPAGEWVHNAASAIWIPLRVGGGIGSQEDIRLVLEAGARKVSMNSAAVKNPDLVSEAARTLGSKTITVAIDGRRNPAMPSGFEVVVSRGRKPAGLDAVAWARECEGRGAGVILPTSMDGDGTQAGYDLAFTKAIADAVSVPVVAFGGAGTLEHFYEAVVQGSASILLAASVFHYRILSIRQVKNLPPGKGAHRQSLNPMGADEASDRVEPYGDRGVPQPS